MDDQTLLHYSRQILLPEIDAAGQQRLLDARALVIGAGGLGSAAALYLASAGVGHLTIADDDVVELSNLQRQILHRYCDLGRAKVDSARDTLEALNPDVEIEGLRARLDDDKLRSLVGEVDVVVDGSDNFATRFAVNAACVHSHTPLVSGAAIRLEGQLAVFDTRHSDSPCYACLYRDGEETDQACSENGVLSPVVGVIGSLQALEAIKVLLGIGESLCGRLLLFDALYHEWRTVRLRRDPDCQVCGPARTLHRQAPPESAA